MNTENKCPVMGGVRRVENADIMSNKDWWPNQLNIKMLHQNSDLSNPMGKDFDYASEFKNLDLDSVKSDLYALMTDSQ